MSDKGELATTRCRLRYIVLASAGYYDTGDELNPDKSGPFGFSRRSAAERKAAMLERWCSRYVRGQVRRVSREVEESWGGPYLWDVTVVELPFAIPWEGGDPLESWHAEIVRREGRIRGERLQDLNAMVASGAIRVSGGIADHSGERNENRLDAVVDYLRSAIEVDS